MDLWAELAGDYCGPVAAGEHPGHDAQQDPLVVEVVAGEGEQQAFQTHLHCQGQLRVLEADEETCGGGDVTRGLGERVGHT